MLNTITQLNRKIMELILTDIELGIETLDAENNSFDVWYHRKNNIFVAVNPITKESYRYRLTKPLEDILFESSKEIIESRLSNRTKETEITIGDVFMYGKYIEQIK